MRAVTYDKLLLVTLLCLAAASPRALLAESKFTPIVETKIAFLDAKVAGEEESGGAAVVAPGFEYRLDFPTASLSLSYQIQAIRYSDLERDDRDVPRARLASEFIHERGRWRSTVFGTIRQADTDVDGILTNRDEIFNDQTEELRVVGAGTFLTGRFGPVVDYRASLGVDAANFEDSDDTTGGNFGFSVDNLRSTEPLIWTSSLRSEVTETKTDGGREDSQIDALAIGLNYRINNRWQVFGDATANETDEEDLDQDRLLVGLAWSPRTYTSVRLGVGEIGDSESYSLDAETRGRSIRLRASYDEVITTARTETLNALSQDALIGSVNTQSLSAEPVLQQRADLGLTVEGIRSEFDIGLFDYTRDDASVDETEKGSGVQLIFTRRLPRESRLEFAAFGQRTELIETNDLLELSIDFRRQQSPYVEIGASLIASEQTSTLPANEYEQLQLVLTALARF